jgi:hypothetical protein
MLFMPHMCVTLWEHQADKTKFFNFLNWRVAQTQKHNTLAEPGATHVSIFGLYPETTSRKQQKSTSGLQQNRPKPTCK